MKRNEVYLNLNSIRQRTHALHGRTLEDMTAEAKTLYPSLTFTFKDEREAALFLAEDYVLQASIALGVTIPR